MSTPRNTIRAEVVRFFAHKGDEDHCIRGTEIFLRGAWVEGHLDLLFAHIPYALLFYRCHFDSDVNVIRAECPALYMSGSRLSGGLKGDGMKVSGGMFMRNGFSAKGKVQLLGANVGGNLNCVGGEFQNSDDGALIANHAKVGGGVFLGRKFAAGGEVRLIGADIGGNLNCSGGQFVAKVRRAINASRAKIGGDVLLNEGFYANGEVRLFGASVSGKMDCAGGQFVNPGDEGEHGERIYALNAELVKTGGHVYLNKRTPEGEDGPFIADGRVRFANAHIGGNFNCKGGRFRHSGKRSALAAGGLRSRAVFLSEEFSAEGEVALHVAHIGNFVCAGCVPNDKSPITINLSSTEAAAVDDDEESWKPFNFLLDGFTYDTFYGRSPTDSTRRLEWLSKRPDKRTLKDGTEVDIPFSPLPYEQAAKVLFEMGHDNDAREILLKKEQEVTKRKNWWHKPYRWLWGEFAGYGYKPGRLLMWALAVVGIGWGVFSHAAEIGGIVPHQPAILASHGSQMPDDRNPLSVKSVTDKFPEYPEFNPLVFSADVFIPVFALHQEPSWYPAVGRRDVAAWLGANEVILGITLAWIILGICLLVALAEELFMGARWAQWREGTIRLGGLVIRFAGIVGCLYKLGMDSPKHWYWLEIGFGWVLTSLFLLSITGLLRPRQSSGEKG